MLMLVGCGDGTRQAITFSCTSTNVDSTDAIRDVRFHYDDGFLFLQNDAGGADNVCSQVGTTDCDVELTRTTLSLRQTVENRSCAFRPMLRTTLNIDRQSGTFQLTQEDCNPRDDLIVEGLCQ